ncbi:hypothetical protein SR187_2150 [Streptococcus ruminantium]|uniref:Uncharacterized protein n=1 Tax=Streptococcus ruminantium TaxID=1917441 RepID=A0A2Z5TKW0_9STRE|nr:hypothetical protein SR187_2150 [Streptococcus ruminantium]
MNTSNMPADYILILNPKGEIVLDYFFILQNLYHITSP